MSVTPLFPLSLTQGQGLDRALHAPSDKEALFFPEISGASLVFCRGPQPGHEEGVRIKEQWQNCLFRVRRAIHPSK